MYHWNIKFQEKIFTCKKVIQLWNFGNFGISEIIPKTLVTLRFLKVSLHELESNCKCFQMRYWPIFYIHPTHNSTHFSTWPGRKITNAHDCKTCGSIYSQNKQIKSSAINGLTECRQANCHICTIDANVTYVKTTENRETSFINNSTALQNT